LNKKHKKILSVAVLAIIFSISRYEIATSLISYTSTVTINVKPQPIYLHRTPLLNGKLMDTTPPPLNQPETSLTITRSQTVYFYTPELFPTQIKNGTWTLHLWASTRSNGRTSRLTVTIHIVSPDGSVEKALIGSVTNIPIDYGYSERIIAIAGETANITLSDRIRLALNVQSGSNDQKGISLYYDGYGTHQTLGHETRLEPPK
jgi:hypothetical protein